MIKWEKEDMVDFEIKESHSLETSNGLICIGVCFDVDGNYEMNVNDNIIVDNTNISLKDAKLIILTDAIEAVELAHKELLQAREDVKNAK